jgi:hypothetical protein
MAFFSSFFSTCNIKKLEKQAKEILDLPKDLRAFRVDKEIVIVDASQKITHRIKDTLPTNPARASLELIKRFKLATEEIKQDSKNRDVWTCGFRDNEARWVWYRNSEPKMTVSYNEAFKNGTLEDKTFFFSARYGTTIISKIKQETVEKVAKDLNALILERPYVKVSCQQCNNEENYTIDDLVDQNKNPDYSSNFIVCQHCNEIVRLQ